MKILIVEDEEALVELMSAALKKEGFIVETASDYHTAVSKLAVYAYDCVLLDIMLPGGSGLDLLRKLKADGDRTWVKLDLVASESCFVVFQKGAPGESYKEKRKVSTIPFVHDWILRYPEGWGVPESIRVSALKPWKDLDVSDEGKAFSGSVRYETQVDIAKEPGKQYVLDLGQVDMVASVSVNGKFVRNLWCAPYKVDVTCALQDGANTLSIEVTSTWFNRLVYDASLPEPERKTWVLRWPSKDALLQPCGLMGPVEVTVWEERGTSVGR